MKLYRVTDDSGFLAIVNSARYNAFVSSDWEFDDLVERFKIEMNANNLIIWSSGRENLWNIQILDCASDRKAVRQFDKLIEVTEGRLLLTNYEDLTMAAQFEDEPLITKSSQNRLFDIKNGLYKATIRQMYHLDAMEAAPSDEQADFEIIFTSATKENSTQRDIEAIIWMAS